ncbi:LacI family DNA-binding transcriptional regulator [Glycomyces albus]
MRTRRTGRLAVLLPTMFYNPARMLHGATEAAHEAGFIVEAVSVIGDTEARTERMLEIAGTGQVEGILALAPISPGAEDHLPQGETIVVAADFDDQMRGIRELADASPLVEIMERLVELGHRRFFHVAGNLQFASARARKAAFLETIERLNLESAGVVDGDWSGKSGYDAVRSLSDKEFPTAVIAANDIMAAGALRALIDRGAEVPGDASVTGWDNNEACWYMPPSLTSVEVNLEGMGRNAMLNLIKAISGRELEPSPRPLQRAIWRESTGPTTRR